MGFNCAFPLSYNQLKAHYTLALWLLSTALAPYKLSGVVSFKSRAKGKHGQIKGMPSAGGRRGCLGGEQGEREMVPRIHFPLGLCLWDLLC